MSLELCAFFVEANLVVCSCKLHWRFTAGLQGPERFRLFHPWSTNHDHHGPTIDCHTLPTSIDRPELVTDQLHILQVATDSAYRTSFWHGQKHAITSNKKTNWLRPIHWRTSNFLHVALRPPGLGVSKIQETSDHPQLQHISTYFNHQFGMVLWAQL